MIWQRRNLPQLSFNPPLLFSNKIYIAGDEKKFYILHSNTRNYVQEFCRKNFSVILWDVRNNFFSSGVVNNFFIPTFVGGLNQRITAFSLFVILNEIFDNICEVKLNIDQHNYPSGSAIVKFTNFESYLFAIQTEFIYIQTRQIYNNRIQIKPFDNTRKNIFPL